VIGLEEIKKELEKLGQKAKEAAIILASTSLEVRNDALKSMALALRNRADEILAANEVDMEKGREGSLSKALLDRLLLTENRIEEMASGLEALISLADPLGRVTEMNTRPNGLMVGQITVPLGVVGVIYEARPNVTVDAAGLCLKTGNAIILRGGSEAFNSNRALVQVIASAAESVGLPRNVIQFVPTTDRQAVEIMLKMRDYLDLLIPRGGAGLIKMVVDNATVPVIETGVGNCHAFVDRDAELKMAVDIVDNAKTQRPGVCNALETCLVDSAIASQFLPVLAERLLPKGVEIRGDEVVREYIPQAVPATEEDWEKEYLDLILAVKVVDGLKEALEHIRKYSTGHSETIITENYSRAQEFLKKVDAAAVYVNASTRFTDGYQFGYGAEIGISTQKLHARGPMGPESLTTKKYIIYGNGQVRK